TAAGGRLSKRKQASPGLESADYHFQELTCPPGQRVDALRVVRPGNHGGEDVFAAQGHRQTGKGHGFEQPVMVDFAETGSAILIPRKVAVILDAEAPKFRGAFLDVGNGIDVEVIHDIAGIVVDLDAVVRNFADDLGAGLAGSGVSAVLLH